MTAPAPVLRCSSLSEAFDEPLAGSAPQARAWVALEQPGPWGARAFTESHLDPVVGRALEQSAAAHGVRPCLIRRPGRHADATSRPRRLLVAHTVPGATWLLSGSVDDPAELLPLDWAAVDAGRLDDVRRSLPGLALLDEPQLLVCTNGTRDVCCAAVGRPVAAAAAHSHPDRVWEVTHTSGHRFAPTAVLLPSGYLHGRLSGAAAAAVLDGARRGELVTAGCRGRSTWPGPAQVAELAVREATGERGLDAVSMRRSGDEWVVSTPGCSHVVAVDSVEDTGVLRPESCGKVAVPVRRYAVRSLTEG